MWRKGKRGGKLREPVTSLPSLEGPYSSGRAMEALADTLMAHAPMAHPYLPVCTHPLGIFSMLCRGLGRA